MFFYKFIGEIIYVDPQYKIGCVYVRNKIKISHWLGPIFSNRLCNFVLSMLCPFANYYLFVTFQIALSKLSASCIYNIAYQLSL